MSRKNGKALAIRSAISTVPSTKGESAYACLIKIALVLNKKAAPKAKIEPSCILEKGCFIRLTMQMAMV